MKNFGNTHDFTVPDSERYIRLDYDTQMGGAAGITAAYLERYKYYSRFTIGPPVASPDHTARQMEEWGLVGLYEKTDEIPLEWAAWAMRQSQKWGWNLTPESVVKYFAHVAQEKIKDFTIQLHQLMNTMPDFDFEVEIKEPEPKRYYKGQPVVDVYRSESTQLKPRWVGGKYVYE